MKTLYAQSTANYPRLKTDKFFLDYKNEYSFNEITNDTALFCEKNQLLDAELWKTFVSQFSSTPDSPDLGWRCEYWGKLMRGACFVYSYTKNPELLNQLKATVCDIINTQDERGRISSYAVADEFGGWDMWGRKYVLLGMQYFLEINDDADLEKEIIKSMCRQVDYIMSKVGKRDDGKIPITRTSKHWYGLNSSSILEPVVRLYNITGDTKYLDFAQYIADEGATFAENIFRLAEKKQLHIHQYPVTKAYEMTSCFEGLCELYRITKTPWYKTAILNFADLILEDELSVIGCAGCTYENFDHATVRQANTNNPLIMQETCVTVTLMKFFLQLTLLTGNSKYSDAFEIAYYNAYLGSVNTENAISSVMATDYPELKATPLPFDSYSPLTSGKRGVGIGGFKKMDGGKYYGCCVCIAAAGVGMVPKAAYLTAEDGTVINMYISGNAVTYTPTGQRLELNVTASYPADGNIEITLNPEHSEHFAIYLRNPQYSQSTYVFVNGTEAPVNDGYIKLEKTWSSGDKINISLDMAVRPIYPIPYGSQVIMSKVVWGTNSVTIPEYDEEDPQAKNHIALRRGPLMLAQDSRFGYDTEEPFNPLISDGVATATPVCENLPFKALFAADITLTDGKSLRLCDYSSAGKLWNEQSKIAVWIKTRR